MSQTIQLFHFCTNLTLQESLGLRAARLPELANLLRQVPESSIYYHTHHFLFQHHYLTSGPTSDLAYWVGEVLREEALAEQLAGVDTMQYFTLEALRRTLVDTIEEYLERAPTSRAKFAVEGEEFFFMKSVRIIMPTSYAASTLEEFADALERVSVRSLYHHVFDARLRLGQPTNDFALWLSDQHGLPELAQQIAQLDPYAYTLEGLRAMLLGLIRGHLRAQKASSHAVAG